MNTKYLIMHHSADLDGKCSSMILKKYLLENNSDSDITMYPINYGQSIPIDLLDENTVVYLADFSFSYDRMVEIYNTVKEFIWIDHHVSAIEDSITHRYDYYKGIREIGKAACELCWEYCYPDTKIPHAVTLLGRFDVMDKTTDGIFQFQYGIHSVLNSSTDTDAIWNSLLNTHHSPDGYYLIDRMLKEGELIHQYMINEYEKLCEHGSYEIEFDGLKAIVYNYIGAYSFFFDSVYDPSKHDLMLKYGYDPKANAFACSIYTTKEDIDCSAIAKKYNGGGHAGAAGFKLPVTEISTLTRVANG